MKQRVPIQNQVPLWKPLTVRNFFLLFLGETISIVGDQFYLVGLPWLTLQLTNSGISLGTVLMAAAIPRAILMLIGGVFSDRFSPRLVMIVGNSLRALLTILLTVIIALGATELWHLYLFAILFGILDGFFIPATKSIVPKLVNKEYLVASNTLIELTNRLALLIGPALGGLLISVTNIQTAFAINAATFIFTTATLLLIEDNSRSNAEIDIQKNILSKKIFSLIIGIGEGINYVLNNRPLKVILLVLVMLNFLILGPLQVGIPSLADSRFAGGPIALGIMNSAWGGGGLLGTLMPQILPKIPRLGIIMVTLASIQGFGLFLLGFIPNLLLASITIGILGLCSGFFTVLGIVWIQKQTPPEILGRVMSLGMLASFGIAPFSLALAGLLADNNLTVLFTVSGGIMSIISLFFMTQATIRQI
ncbi:MAG: MFS transporter [Prochloraceae cyanobacterium]|nr:MFS transporter [Prochloraceae cyanobacterium]